jgi:hypothetical protein
MTPSRSRFVTVCQQLLALAVVLAVLTPAASIVTLDVVGSGPEGSAGATTLARPSAQTAAYTAEAVRPSRVPTAPVKADVREVQLTAASAPAGRAVRATAAARVVASPTGVSRLTTTPQPITGFGEVGVTWAHGVRLPQDAITVAVRTLDHGTWSGWRTIPYDPEHGPDPGSAEARHARPGTEPMLVGEVARVQVRAVSSRPLPADMKLAVIAPGHAAHTLTERAALDTSTMDGDQGADSVYRAVDPQPATGDTARLSAAVFTPRPVIYSRAQWGADESIRGKSSLHYGDVHAGFVHHTVNANSYTRAEVPGLLRSIYAYHVKSRGWSDIGYNYLVDRFGRIWEGRYGGIDRAVVGAHTLGYNDDSFAASAIGNYELVHPSEAVLQAYGALFAWKLSLHGVDASSTRQYVTTRWFQAINGHRDAASTACPGQFLYDRLPTIRRLAAADQRGWSGRQLESNLASTPAPDLVVRRASDGEAFVIPTGGLIHFPAATTVATGVTGATGVLLTGDVTGDGRTDLLVRRTDGSVAVRPGTASGGFGASGRVIAGFVGKDLVSAPGDLNGDGRADLTARNPATGGLVLLLQRPDHTFRRVVAGTTWGSYDLIAAAGDLNGDGHPDLVARDAAGALWRFAGDGHAGFASAVRVAGGFGGYATITGGGDLTADGLRDLLVRDRATGATYVVPGRGDGTFGRRLGPFARLASAPAPTVGDVGGSAAPDVVSLVGTAVRAWINPGSFDLGRPIDTGVRFTGATQILAVGDWDRDGYGDVVTRQTAGTLVLWLGNGHGRLTRAGVLASGFGSVARLTAVGDMTGDGYPDLLGQPSGGVLRIYPGRGAVGLKQSYPAYHTAISGAQIGVGRWNADGAPDTLVRSGPRLTLYAGNGPGGLGSPSRLPVDLSPYDWVIGVSDLTLTGHPDLLVRQKGTGLLFALQGTPTGLLAPVYLGQGLGGYDLAG